VLAMVFINIIKIMKELVVSLFYSLMIFFSIIKYYITATRSDDAILLFIPGASIQDMYNKFGTLDVYGINQTGFTKKLLLILWGNNNFKIEISNGVVINEVKITGNKLSGLVKAVYKMIQLCSRYDVKIIHSNDPYVCGVCCYVVSIFLKKPFSVSIHMDYSKIPYIKKCSGTFSKIASFISLEIEKFIYDKSTMILPISNHLSNYIQSRGADLNKIRIFRHGVRDIRLDDSVEIEKREGVFWVTCVSRLEREKYIYDAIRCAEIICSSRDDVIFVFVGNGSEKEKIEKKLSEKFKSRILLVGFLNNDKVYEIYRKSDVVLSVLGGFSLIEAMMCSCPIVAYDIEWQSEAIVDNDTGLLVDFGNVQMLCDKINFLLDNIETRWRLSKRAREHAQTVFSESASKKNKIKIFQEIIDVYGKKERECK